MQIPVYAMPDRCFQRGGVILRALVFLTGLVAGWIAWQMFLDRGRPTVSARTGSPPAAPANLANPGFGPGLNPRAGASSTPLNQNRAFVAATNGALVIPVRDASGATRESMVLVPVRTDPAPPGMPGSNRPPVAVSAQAVPAVPIVSAGTAGGSDRNVRAVGSASSTANRPALRDRTLEGQVALVRNGISPGSIDGVIGSQTRAAVRAFQMREGLPVTGSFDDATLARLIPEGSEGATLLYTNYVVAPEDVATLLPLSRTWLGKSEQARLDFESILELVAERTRTHPNLVRRLNPDVNWSMGTTGTNPTAGAPALAGTSLKVLNTEPPPVTEKAALLRIRLADRTLQAFGAGSNLLAHFPCSIAQRVEKRPVGEALHVAVVAPDPNYTFDPAVFPESAEARELGRKLILQPGPNNPVGSVWIGLDKPGYGIHGTPKPEEVGRTESHGCFRLANWNARHLLDLVSLGTAVEVLP